jgi:hypothetical protein
MRNIVKWFIVMAVGGLMTASAFGLAVGNNITVWDQHGGGGIGPGGEDEEQDAGSTRAKWDIEGFFLNDWTLSLVATYDLKNGQSYSGGHIYTGDIFIDVDGNFIKPGNPDPMPNHNGAWDYDYVLDIDWAAGSYEIYDLNPTVGPAPISETVPLHFYHDFANPVRLANAGDLTAVSGAGGTLGYFTGVTDTMVGGLLGGAHNVAQFDLSGISAALQDASGKVASGTHFHATMDCGNDTTNGQVPDGGATIALLGIALMGMGTLARKR